MAKKLKENSKADKVMDKKKGIKENSKADKKMDKPKSAVKIAIKVKPVPKGKAESLMQEMKPIDYFNKKK